jgi:hypothetical protein
MAPPPSSIMQQTKQTAWLSSDWAVRCMQSAMYLMPRRKVQAVGELADDYKNPSVRKTASFWLSHGIVLLWPTSLTDAVVRFCMRCSYFIIQCPLLCWSTLCMRRSRAASPC